MSADTFTELSRHIGHAVAVVEYAGQEGNAVNVAVECETCFEVLMDYEREDKENV